MRLLRVVALASVLACATEDTIEFERIPPPAAASGAWRAAQACSHVAPTAGGDLSDVHWFVADLSIEHHRLMGAWLPPDTIVLDRAYAQDSVTIEHELLHHLLRGRVNGQSHPFVPFVWPCKLIAIIGG